jgi:hypothetical protein
MTKDRYADADISRREVAAEIGIFRGQAKLKPPKPGEAKRKKLHWKTARKMEREVADPPRTPLPPRRRLAGVRPPNQEAEANSRGRLVAMPVL